MFVKQLSIFVENKQGRLEKIISELGKNDINISALSMADTTDFGILRLIADQPEKAKEILNEIGVIAKLTDVMAVVIDDNSGGLASVLSLISQNGISIEYMYAFLGKVQGKALMVFKVSDAQMCEKILTEKGISLAQASDVYRI